MIGAKTVLLATPLLLGSAMQAMLHGAPPDLVLGATQASMTVLDVDRVLQRSKIPPKPRRVLPAVPPAVAQAPRAAPQPAKTAPPAPAAAQPAPRPPSRLTGAAAP